MTQRTLHYFNREPDCTCQPMCCDLCIGECGCLSCQDAMGERLHIVRRETCAGCGNPWPADTTKCPNKRCQRVDSPWHSPTQEAEELKGESHAD